MGKIIFIDEFRKRRCLESLLADIGLPRYCDECGDLDAELLFTVDDLSLETATLATPHAPALIVAFPTHANNDESQAATANAPKSRRRRTPRQ